MTSSGFSPHQQRNAKDLLAFRTISATNYRLYSRHIYPKDRWARVSACCHPNANLLTLCDGWGPPSSRIGLSPAQSMTTGRDLLRCGTPSKARILQSAPLATFPHVATGSGQISRARTAWAARPFLPPHLTSHRHLRIEVLHPLSVQLHRSRAHCLHGVGATQPPECPCFKVCFSETSPKKRQRREAPRPRLAGYEPPSFVISSCTGGPTQRSSTS